MKNDRGVWFVVDDFQRGEGDSRDVISSLSGMARDEGASSQCPDFGQVIFECIQEMLHGFRFLTAETSATWVPCQI